MATAASESDLPRDALPPPPTRPPGKPPTARAGGSGGSRPPFLLPYKPREGYWTRLGTAAGAAILLAFTCFWLWGQVAANVGDPSRRLGWQLGIVVPVAVVGALALWRLMNRPKGAQFLIDTDAEMNKVAWPSRRDLFGATRVVIAFMLTVALVLFVYDIVYSIAFQQAGLLQTSILDFLAAPSTAAPPSNVPPVPPAAN